MGLNKDICFNCCLGWHVSASPAVLGTRIGEARAEFVRQFEEDWLSGFVQCRGVGALSVRDSPIRTGIATGAQGVYIDTDIMVDGPVPGFCLDKRGQFGDRLWADYVKAIEDGGEMKDGEVVADEERIQRRIVDEKDGGVGGIGGVSVSGGGSGVRSPRPGEVAGEGDRGAVQGDSGT
jgi:hypothetical protein